MLLAVAELLVEPSAGFPLVYPIFVVAVVASGYVEFALRRKLADG